jgi:hypothetical protein
MLGKGDYVIAQATYSKGAINYIANGFTADYNIRTGSGASLMTAYGPVYDSTYGLGTDQDLTEAWSVTAGYEHRWNPNWKTSIYGAYGEINYSDTSSARIALLAAPVGVPAGSADWSLSQIGSRTVWTPVKNLDLSVDILYNHVNTAFGGDPAYEDKGWLAGMFRAQRNFYP